MENYIKNKRREEKLVSIFSILFWVINFIFVEISVSMLLMIITANKSSWFDRAAKFELTNDPFFINRTDTIIGMIVFVMVIVIMFAVFTVVLYRQVQLKNMLTQMAMFRILGYDKGQIMKICLLHPVADMAISFPISIVCSTIIWTILSKNENVELLLKLMNVNVWIEIVAFILCAIFVVLIIIIHTKIFIERSLKKGIRYMLGQGVV